MDDETPSRRKSDKRLDNVERGLKEVATDVRSIRDMLISEPEASPLGRALLKRTDALERRVDPIERWYHESAGAWKVIVGAAIVLGGIGAFFGIASWLGFGPA